MLVNMYATVLGHPARVEDARVQGHVRIKQASSYLYMVINLALRMPVLRATTMSSKKKTSTTTSIPSVGIEVHSGSSLHRVDAEYKRIKGYEAAAASAEEEGK